MQNPTVVGTSTVRPPFTSLHAESTASRVASNGIGPPESAG